MVLTMSIGIPLCFLLQKGRKFAANTENKRLLETVASNPNNVHEEDWKRFYAPHFVEIIFQSQGAPLPERIGAGFLCQNRRLLEAVTSKPNNGHVIGELIMAEGRMLMILQQRPLMEISITTKEAMGSNNEFCPTKPGTH